MRIIRHLRDLPFDRLADGSIVTVGAYDGLHRGHQALIKRVLEEAERRKLPSVLMSFEPTPKEFFARSTPPARLMGMRDKVDGMQAAGLDYFFCVRFNAAMRDISAADFIRQYLVHGLNAQHLVVGDDFRFARRREGDLATLIRAGNALDYSVEHVGSVIVDGERVSSTTVRNALESGDDQRAARLLGRPFRISGKVISGQQLGRKLGYPTANISLGRRESPVKGIYAVRVNGLGAKPIDGVASVGTRPTFTNGHMLLEVHLFDFDQTIYGKLLQVDFIRKLRNEEKFAGSDELIEQMHLDARAARAALSGNDR